MKNTTRTPFPRSISGGPPLKQKKLLSRSRRLKLDLHNQILKLDLKVFHSVAKIKKEFSGNFLI